MILVNNTQLIISVTIAMDSAMERIALIIIIVVIVFDCSNNNDGSKNLMVQVAIIDEKRRKKKCLLLLCAYALSVLFLFVCFFLFSCASFRNRVLTSELLILFFFSFSVRLLMQIGGNSKTNYRFVIKSLSFERERNVNKNKKKNHQ